jgi:hypothetical protein
VSILCVDHRDDSLSRIHSLFMYFLREKNVGKCVHCVYVLIANLPRAEIPFRWNLKAGAKSRKPHNTFRFELLLQYWHSSTYLTTIIINSYFEPRYPQLQGRGLPAPFFMSVCRSVDGSMCRSVPFCHLTNATKTCLLHVSSPKYDMSSTLSKACLLSSTLSSVVLRSLWPFNS